MLGKAEGLAVKQGNGRDMLLNMGLVVKGKCRCVHIEEQAHGE